MVFILITVLKILSIVVPLLIAVAYFTIAERKIMGAIQRRRGPNVIGFIGLLQPLADGLKLFAKETTLPTSTNTGIFLIAPSLAFILYAILTEQSIGALFLAGILPGILMALLMMLTVYIICRIDPQKGPAGPKTTFKEKILALKGVGPIIALFILVMGGIYFGIFTPVEGAGVGATGALLYAVITKRFSFSNFKSALQETIKTGAMALFILVGSVIFGTFMAISGIPMAMANFATALPVPPTVVFVFILLVYFSIPF